MEGINPLGIYNQKINMINNRISAKMSAVGIDSGFSGILKSIQEQDADIKTQTDEYTEKDKADAVKQLGISPSGVLWSALTGSNSSMTTENTINSLIGSYSTDMSSDAMLRKALLNAYSSDTSTGNLIADALIDSYSGGTSTGNLLADALIGAYGRETSADKLSEKITASDKTYNTYKAGQQTANKVRETYAGSVPDNGIFDMSDINRDAEIGKHTEYEYLIGKAAEKYGVDDILIKAIIKAESDFNPECVSGAGAVGLMQLMPGTAELMGVKDSRDPEENINGGVGYFKQQLDAFGGDIKMALAAYNCGPSKLKKLGVTSLENMSDFAKLPKETQNYVNKIINSIR